MYLPLHSQPNDIFTHLKQTAPSMGGAEYGAQKEHAKNDQWNPYDNNMGTVLAVGLPGLVVVAGDTRISKGYGIISREASKVVQLTDKCFLATSGMYADFIALRKTLEARLQAYEYQNERQATTETLAQLLSRTLYGKRFFPFYTFNLLAGLDENDVGRVYGYDAIGSYDTVSYGVQGSGQELIVATLDNQFMAYNKRVKNIPSTKEEVIDLVKDCFNSAAERDIYTGDMVEIYILTKEGVEKALFRGNTSFLFSTVLNPRQIKLLDSFKEKEADVKNAIRAVYLQTNLIEDTFDRTENFNLLNKEKLRAQQIYLDLQQNEIMQTISYVKENHTREELVQQTIDKMIQVLKSDLSQTDYLQFIRNITNLQVEKSIKYAIERQNFYQLSQEPVWVPISILIHFFKVMRDINFDVESEQFVDCQTLKYRLFHKMISSCSLNQIFTLIVLDSREPRRRSFYQLSQYKNALVQLGQSVRWALIRRIQNPYKTTSDLKVLQSFDFYLSASKFLKKMLITQSDIYTLLENQFIKNCLKEQKVTSLKSIQILFNTIGQFQSGNELIKIYGRILQLPGTEQFLYSVDPQLNIFNAYQLLTNRLDKVYDHSLNMWTTEDYQGFIEKLKQETAVLDMIQTLMQVAYDQIVVKKEEIIHSIYTITLAVTTATVSDILIMLRPNLKELAHLKENVQSLNIPLETQNPNEMSKDIEICLSENQIRYKTEFQIEGRRVDFYLPDFKICIEADGEYHFGDDKALAHTILRNFYLVSKGYRLLSIKSADWEQQRALNTHHDYFLQLLKKLSEDRNILFVR